MANVFVYTIVPGKLKVLLKKIQEVGVPARVTQGWLESVGFTSKNDRALVRVLKFLDFANEDGTPTQKWRDYRGEKSSQVLGSAIRGAYSDLFSMYQDAQNRSADEIASFFAARTDSGREVVNRAVSTFMALCAEAEFTDGQEDFSANPTVGNGSIDIAEKREIPPPRSSHDFVVNINIQLTVPESTNIDVYSNFFRAMRTELLTDEISSGTD